MKLGTLLSWIMTILSIGMTLYIWVKDSKEKEPTLIVNPVRTKIVDSDLIKRKPFNITDSAGKTINESIYVATFYFFNQGKLAIEKTDVLKPVRIGIEKGGRIIDKRIINKPRDVTELSINKIDSGFQSFLVDFRILEEGDGFAGQIIYSGDADANIIVKGAIKDVKNFTYTYEDVPPEKYVLIIFSSLIVAFVIFNYAIKSLKEDNFELSTKDKVLADLNKSIKKKKTVTDRLTTTYQLVVRNEENLAEKTTVSFTYAKLLVFTTALFSMMSISSLLLSKSLLSKWFEPKNPNKLEIPIKLRE